MSLGFGIAGCGLIGRKRAQALCGHRLVACVDVDPDRAAQFALEHGCRAAADLAELVDQPEVDAVVVATSNDALASAALAAISAGKHVLIEKPGARTAAELRPLIDAAKERGVVVKVGFNHRFHPAMQQARQIVDEGQLGPILYLRGRYGHGGRLGYETEWRAQRHIAGGGELLDQGSHLIDLALWFLDPIAQAQGQLATYFWQMEVEDNAFVQLQSESRQTAWLHASWTEWKNLFSFEIFGRDGKLDITGLGGSYGTERLTHYREPPQLGPPETTNWDFPAPDQSWQAEIEHFAAAIEHREAPMSGLAEAIRVLEITDSIYQANAR